MSSAVGLMLFLLSFFGSPYASVIPKCFQMKAEIYHLRQSLFSDSNVTLASGDGLYDPECDPNGHFKAKQCNNSDVCWCVDSKGVRRSRNGDKNLQCEELVLPNWVHKEASNPLELSQMQRAIASVIQEQDNVDPNLDSKTEVKVVMQSLFSDYIKNEPTDEGEKLEFESIMVYYVDENEPTNSMQTLTTGLLTVTGVLILVACVGLLILFLIRRQKRGQYEKAQTSEMEEI